MKDLYLKRKIDLFLVNWKNNPDRKPLIVQGARQIGKTESITKFAQNHYDNFIYINFVLQEEYRTIFDGAFTSELSSDSSHLSKSGRLLYSMSASLYSNPSTLAYWVKNE